MKQSQIQCPIHGREGIGLVCEHIAVAVDRGERVGFYWATIAIPRGRMRGA